MFRFFGRPWALRGGPARPAKGAVPVFVEALNNRELHRPGQRSPGAGGVRSRGAVPALAEALKHSDSFVREFRGRGAGTDCPARAKVAVLCAGRGGSRMNTANVRSPRRVERSPPADAFESTGSRAETSLPRSRNRGRPGAVASLPEKRAGWGYGAGRTCYEREDGVDVHRRAVPNDNDQLQSRCKRLALARRASAERQSNAHTTTSATLVLWKSRSPLAEKAEVMGCHL